MFLGKKPTRLAPATKSRLNTHTKLETVETPRKKSPDGTTNPGPPSPSEVLVFNTHHGGATRAGHYNRSLPEVPNIEEIHQFMKDSWDERIARINNPANKLNVLWIKSFAEEEREREEAEKAAAAAAQTSTGTPSSSGAPTSVAGAASLPQQNTYRPRNSSTSTASSSTPSASSSSASTPTTSAAPQTYSKNFYSPQHSNPEKNRTENKKNH